jgi:hypothetical protein
VLPLGLSPRQLIFRRCRHALGSALPAGLAIFLNSLGELTAYDSDGDMLWQVGPRDAFTPASMCQPALQPDAAHGTHRVPAPDYRRPCCCTPCPCAAPAPRFPCPCSTLWAPPGKSQTTRMYQRQCPRCAPWRCAPAPSPLSSWQVGRGWGGVGLDHVSGQWTELHARLLLPAVTSSLFTHVS